MTVRRVVVSMVVAVVSFALPAATVIGAIQHRPNEQAHGHSMHHG
ncbi:hypothetical protein [Nostocoides vanveenii]